jgi:hypothetical protein
MVAGRELSCEQAMESGRESVVKLDQLVRAQRLKAAKKHTEGKVTWIWSSTLIFAMFALPT